MKFVSSLVKEETFLKIVKKGGMNFASLGLKVKGVRQESIGLPTQ
jgi:hypothetical protein